MKYAIIVIALGLIAIGTSGSFATTSSTAGDPIYMQYGTIQGDVTATGHEHWIELNSFQWGVGRTISSPTSGTAREGSAPSISEITITKVMDQASTQLVKEALTGQGATVTIDFVRTGTSGTPFTYATYILENTLVSGYSVSSGGDRPSESISLNFVQVTYKFFTQNPADGSTSSSSVCWNSATAREC